LRSTTDFNKRIYDDDDDDLKYCELEPFIACVQTIHDTLLV